jgi:hypothetical protein
MRVKLRDVKVGDQAMIGMGYDYFRVMVMAQEPGGKVKVIRTGFGENVNRARVLEGFILGGDHEADLEN